MAVEVVHDGGGLGDLQEYCCVCWRKTPYWYGKGKRNVALCPACAKNANPSELPSKTAWSKAVLERYPHFARSRM